MIPTVAIVVPAYNAAATVADTLESVIAQTFEDWELVVVDDGSTDATAGIVDGYVHRDGRIRRVHQPNAGLAAARNGGVAATRAGHLLFLDADDTIAPDHLARLVESAGGTDEAIVYSGYRRITSAGVPLPPELVPEIERHPWLSFSYSNRLAVHCALVPRRALDEVGRFDTALVTCEDWDMWQRLALAGWQFRFVDAASALYHMRTTSMSRDFRTLALGGLTLIDRARGRGTATDAADKAGVGDGTIAKTYFVLWCIAAAIAAGQDPKDLPGLLPDVDLTGQSLAIAATLQGALAIGAEAPPEALGRVWLRVKDRILPLLRQFDRRAPAAGVSHSIVYNLETALVRHDPLASPLSMSLVFGIAMPLSALEGVPAGPDLAHVRIVDGGEELARWELPCFAAIPARELAERLVAERGATDIAARTAGLRAEGIRSGLRDTVRIFGERSVPASARASSWIARQPACDGPTSGEMGAAIGADAAAGLTPAASAATGAPPSMAEGGERRIPVLMYHMVSDGDASRYRVTPAAFADQVRWLVDNGFTTITSDTFHAARGRPGGFAGKPVMLTFDDGYRDFHDHAWPIMAAAGLRADVFIVAGKVGETSSWDRHAATPEPLLDWEQIVALQRDGAGIGSHLLDHRRADSLTSAALLTQAVRSRLILEDRLSASVRAIAAPSGSLDERAIRIFDAAGYYVGFSTRNGIASLDDHPLNLPRIEIHGGMTLADFASAVGGA